MKGSHKIEMILQYLNVSPTEFSSALGFERAQSIYDIQKNKVNISKKMAVKIKSTYPEFNTAWLLTGEGNMLIEPLNEVQEEQERYLINKNPFPKYPSKEWAVMEALVQEIAVDRARSMKRSVVDCLEELYAKIDSIMNAGKSA